MRRLTLVLSIFFLAAGGMQAKHGPKWDRDWDDDDHHHKHCGPRHGIYVYLDYPSYYYPDHRYGAYGLPPGLAKRGGNLPPGLQKHLWKTGHLPRGLEKKARPYPFVLWNPRGPG